MKFPRLLYLCAFTIFLTGCNGAGFQLQVIPPADVTATAQNSMVPTQEATHASSLSPASRIMYTPTMVPTLSTLGQGLAQEEQLAADYNHAVQDKIQKGQVELGKDPVTGADTIRFQGDSYMAMLRLYDTFSQQLLDLNQKYLILYIAQIQSTPFPTQSSEEENNNYYQELIAQYQPLLDQLLKDRPVVSVYVPAAGTYSKIFIGDAYARSEVMWSAIQALSQALQLAKVDQAAEMAQIRDLMGDQELALTFQGIGSLANAPWISSASYADDQRRIYVVAIDANRVATIIPGVSPDIPAAEVKSIDETRPIAEQFAQAISPRYAQMKSEMSYGEGSKGDIYFFTWSTRNRDWSSTDWAMMPPFLSIGVSADGKITTYINTLDLYD